MSNEMYDLAEAMVRLLAMEKEAVSGSGGVDYWPYWENQPPYWMNRIRSMEADPLSVEFVIDRYSVGAILVIDHMTAGYVGEIYARAYSTYIPDVIAFFDNHPLLTSTAYPAKMDWMFNDRDTRGAHITGMPGGTRTVLNTGAGATPQVYLEFTVSIPLLRKQY